MKNKFIQRIGVGVVLSLIAMTAFFAPTSRAAEDNGGTYQSWNPEAAITSLTDNSGGTANNTITAVSGLTTLTDSTGDSGTHNDTVADGTTIGAALTDNSTGAAGDTIAAGVGVYPFTMHFLAATFANGDMTTNVVIPHKFKILKIDSVCTAAVTTGAKTATLNLEIGTTNLTGGVLTLDGTVTLGAYEAATAITAGNTGAAGDNISLEAASVTTFVEGSFTITIWIQNMDGADAVASLAAKTNTLRTDNLVSNQNVSDITQKIIEIVGDADDSKNNFADLTAKIEEILDVMRAQKHIRE